MPRSITKLRSQTPNGLVVDGGHSVPRELNVLALIKGNERYVYVYDDPSRRALIEAFRDQASDPGLTFSWFDAAVLTEKAREQAQHGPAALPASRPWG